MTRCMNTRTLNKIETLTILFLLPITNPLSRYHVSPHYCWPTPLTPLRKFWLAFARVFHPSLYATTRLWDRVQVAKRFRFIGYCSLFRNYMSDLYYVLRMDKLIHDFSSLRFFFSFFFFFGFNLSRDIYNMYNRSQIYPAILDILYKVWISMK